MINQEYWKSFDDVKSCSVAMWIAMEIKKCSDFVNPWQVRRFLLHFKD